MSEIDNIQQAIGRGDAASRAGSEVLSSPFWTRHFGDDEAEVPWERFGAAFKSDVDALGGLPGELQSPAPEHVDWAVDLVRQELEG